MAAGRPTKLTKALQSRVVKALKTGATIEDVCAHAGIGTTTFYRWFDAGRDDETSEYRDFWDAVSRAQADAKMAAIKAIRTAFTSHDEKRVVTDVFEETRLDKNGKPYTYRKVTTSEVVTYGVWDWRAGVEYLKRRHFDEWGDKSKAEHTGKDGGPILHKDVTDMTDDELRAIVEGGG